MKFTNKLVLVPEQSVNNRENEPKSSLEKQVGEFRTELQRILSDTSIPAEEQYQLYSQLFTRYLNLDNEARQPKPIIFKGEEADSVKQDVNWDISALKNIPKSKRDQAGMLVEYIKHNNNMVQVNNNGEIVINNEPIVNSHIIDLINDFTRVNVKADPPIGAAAFAKVLKLINVPRSYIGNSKRWKMINSTVYKDEQALDSSFYQSASVPESTIRRKRSASVNSGKYDKNTPSTFKREHRPIKRKIFPYTPYV
jgi:hypothetical protein